MINLAPSAMDHTAESISHITDNVPILGNAALCADSLCTSGRACINFYCCSNPVARVFFAASCVCGVMGVTSSGIALATSSLGIPMGGWLGSLGARSFNRLGKYTLYMGNMTNGNMTNGNMINGNMTNGNITNITDAIDLMSW